MQQFKNILVAVDLSCGDHLVSSDLSPPTLEAIERAQWLAKLNSARLTLLGVLDVSPASQRIIEKASEDRTVLTEANEALDTLVAAARAENIQASAQIRFGKSWVEIIRQAIENDADLVVAGTRHLGSVQGALLGSTGIKLLRKCPIPVWITQPQAAADIKSILVAHCLRSVGNAAMELASFLAEHHNAQLHVLHSLEFPEIHSPYPESVPAERAAQFRSNAENHIESQIANYSFALPPRVHISSDPPDFAVLNYLKEHEIELIVMGTVARTGIAGFITGNTAERLLPQIPCSILAVKPKGFVSPVAVAR